MLNPLHSCLLALPPETAHKLALQMLDVVSRFLPESMVKVPQLPCNVMGINFVNPIGLAAGFDKSGESIRSLGYLGFGFLELGTVTPQPQFGNPKPRLFRLNTQHSLINRMGFNNLGMIAVASKIKATKRRSGLVLGINIGKNAFTPISESINDYIACLKNLYEFGDYFAINISSPNTKQLRQLQEKRELIPFLRSLIDARNKLADHTGIKKPLAIKISPDLEDMQIQEIADVITIVGIEGVIATNTTTQPSSKPVLDEIGGISGEILRNTSTKVIGKLRRYLPPHIAVIGVGGVMSAKHALEKIDAGADLVQLYTGLVYRGPSLIKEITDALHNTNTRI